MLPESIASPRSLIHPRWTHWNSTTGPGSVTETQQISYKHGHSGKILALEFTPADSLSTPKHFTWQRHAPRPETFSETYSLLPGGWKCMRDDLDVASFCSTPKLQIIDQVGGPANHLHYLPAVLLCVNDGGDLHTRDCSALSSSTCLFSKVWAAVIHRSKYVALLRLVHNNGHSVRLERTACCRRPAGKRQSWPSVAQDEMSCRKTAQAHRTYSGIFPKDHNSGCILWIFGWFRAQKCFTDNEVHSEMAWEHLVSL